MGAKKNLVLALAKGYNWYVLEPFIRSFIKNVSNADMVLFVGDMSPFTMHKLEEVGKEIQGGELRILPFDENLYKGHPANTRWLAFLDFIKEHADEYSQILCPDTRDVFFQGDIFKTFAKHGDYVGISYFGEHNTIGENTLGKDLGIFFWFINAFGKDETERMLDKTTFCPSTIIGTSKELETLLKVLCENIPNYDVFGTDECTLDYVIHHDMVPIKNIVKISAETGEIMHFNILNTECRTEIKNDVVLNLAGIAPDVVHYFDKNILLMNLTDRLYRADDFQIGENFSDSRSMLDQLPHLVNFGKYDEAFNIFMNYLMGGMNFGATFHKKDQETLAKIDFSALTEEDKKKLLSVEVKGYGDTVIRMWEVMLSNDFPLTSSAELLEIAMQHALMESYEKVLPLYRAEKIVACVKIAEQKEHTVSIKFKKFIMERLFERAKVFINDANIKRYMICMELVADLKLPLDEKWKRLKNEANTWFSFYTSYFNDEDFLKRIKEKFKKGKIFYHAYRIDADFENGGIK